MALCYAFAWHSGNRVGLLCLSLAIAEAVEMSEGITNDSGDAMASPGVPWG